MKSQVSQTGHWPTGLKNKSTATFEIEQCWIFAVLWWPFWKWRPVEIFWCQESIQVIIIYPHMKCRWNWTMLNLFGIVATILKMATGRNFSMSGINIYPHIKFWWYRTMLNFSGIVAAILKMVTGRNFSMLGINSGHHYLPT